jgi:Flp pilus assembly pilin Flp
MFFLKEDTMSNLLKRFIDDESGQGITEYGAVLAFVAILVALVIALLQGSLKSSISSAFSILASQMSSLAASAS